MTSMTEEYLVVQREKLRKQLQEQRRSIAGQLSLHTNRDNIYPRSATMRFLTKNPTLMTGLFTEAMMLLAGVRMFKLLNTLLVLVRILRPALINQQKRLPAPLLLDNKIDPV